jgi:Zn-finger protein
MEVTRDFQVTDCCTCGIVFAMPESYVDSKKTNEEGHRTFYCPNGHGLSWKKKSYNTILDELNQVKKENERLRDENVKLLARIDQLEAAK